MQDKMPSEDTKLIGDLIKQGRFDEAHALLIRVANEMTADADLLCVFASLATAIGKYQEAEDYLKSALSFNTGSFQVHYQLGLVLLKQGRPKEAMLSFRESCELNPGFALGNLHWGLALLQMGNVRGALGQFGQAAKLDPALTAAYYQSGMALSLLGQYDEAIENFRKVALSDPNFAAAYNAMGVVFMAVGKNQEAQQSLVKAWQLGDDSPQVHSNWAVALARLGQHDDAQQHCRQAITSGGAALTAKERAAIFNNWGVSLYLNNAVKQAAEKFVEACQIDEGLNEAQVNLGLVRIVLNEYELATLAFENVLRKNPTAAAANMHLGVSYLLSGKPDEALAELSKAERQGVADPQLDVWIAYSHIALGGVDAAKRHFQKVCQNGSLAHFGFDGLGLCLALVGDHESAAKSFEQALTVNKNFAFAHLHLARSLEALGQLGAAKDEYRLALDIDPDCLAPEKEAIELLLNKSEIAEAISRSLRILEIEPHDAQARLALACSLKRQNRLDEALKLAQSVIDLYPKLGRARSEAAQILMAQGRLAEADDLFASASQLDDVEASLYFSWGKTLALLGFYELALEKYQKAWEIDPYDEDIYELWGNTLKALGRFSEAAEIFKRASDYLYK